MTSDIRDEVAAARLEGAKELFREIIGGKCPGFIPAEQGILDASGRAEDWLPVGWIFECFAAVDARLARQPEDQP